MTCLLIASQIHVYIPLGTQAVGAGLTITSNTSGIPPSPFKTATIRSLSSFCRTFRRHSGLVMSGTAAVGLLAVLSLCSIERGAIP
jgi:hypothetical protein